VQQFLKSELLWEKTSFDRKPQKKSFREFPEPAKIYVSQVMKNSHIAFEVIMQTENEVSCLKSLKNMFSVQCDICTLICET